MTDFRGQGRGVFLALTLLYVGVTTEDSISGQPTVRMHSVQDQGRPPGVVSVGYSVAGNQPRVAAHNQTSPPNQSLDELCAEIKCVTTMDRGCQIFQFIVSCVLVGLTCLFGFVGNVLSILTLRRDSIKSVTTFLLSALAVADFSFLVPAVFVIMIPTYCEFYQHCARTVITMIPHFEQYGWAIASTTHSCTVYVTVLVAVHRYLWVCRPGLAQKLSGLGRAKVQVAMVPVFALIYNSPRFVEYQIRHVKYQAGNETIEETKKELAPVGQNKYFQIVYKNVCFFIVMYLIPLAILVMVSVNLIRTLQQRRATLQRIGSTNSNASQSRRDDNITLVLIIIIAAFIVCQTPTMLQRLLLAMARDDGHTCGHPYFYMEHIADYMALLNSSTNFVIYILFSPHFRRTLMSEVLCKGNKGAPGPTALRPFSRLSRKSDSKSRKSDDKNGGRPGDSTDLSPGNNGHITGNGSREHQSNGQAMGVQWLIPPEKSVATSISHSTQVTSQDFMTVSQADMDDADTKDHGKNVTLVVTDSVDVCVCDNRADTMHNIDCGNSSDDQKEIEVPLIAFERASSVVETT